MRPLRGSLINNNRGENESENEKNIKCDSIQSRCLQHKLYNFQVWAVNVSVGTGWGRV